ncbi:hypothetical protein PHLCEN_2v9407 [Hermanssonia centrifuga]|uniref:F-box domain-containing protein n=1 Tax=Hermanssonia centrifuga TaxID=98765 RepID=A0A2R6NQZ2_9APHY|nr:hypothetical protein PHLCEN_2v9407 [Hermanssonia centrifuga]
MPDELILVIHSHFPLSTLIAARGTCRLWRSLIPGTHIPIARRRLLELYIRAIHSPAFKATRPLILPYLQHFDRHRYLSRLPPNLPEEFRCWILEWPAKAVLGSIWPGLTLPSRDSRPPNALLEDGGVSLLHRTQPIMNGLVLDSPVPGHMQTTMSAAGARQGNSKTPYGLLLDTAMVEGWQRSRILVFAGDWGEVDLSGRVYQIDGLDVQVDKPLTETWVGYLQRELEHQELRMLEQNS